MARLEELDSALLKIKYCVLARGLGEAGGAEASFLILHWNITHPWCVDTGNANVMPQSRGSVRHGEWAAELTSV